MNRIPVSNHGQAIDRHDFGLLDSVQFASMEFSHEYMISDVMVKGQPMMIGGPEKSLKTGIMIDMAISLGTGTRFLDRFDVDRPRRVAMFSGESGMGILKRTALSVAASKGTALADANVFWTDNLPGIPKDVSRLRAIIESERIEVLMIDPVYLAIGDAGRQASNLFTMGHVLNPLGQLCQSTGCTIVLCHHLKKSLGRGACVPELSDLSQAGFAEWSRQWLLVGRHKPYANDGQHHLTINIGGSAGHSSRWKARIIEKVDDQRCWKVELSGSQGVDRDAEIRRKVIGVLKQHPRGEVFTCIRDKARISTDDAHKAVSFLTNDELIEECKVARKNKQSYDGYRLTTKALGTLGNTRDQGIPTE